MDDPGGNTVANFLILGWLIVTLLHATQGNLLWFIPSYGGVVILFYAVFDLLPKMLFRLYPNRLCLLLARPFRLVHVGLRPAVALVEYASGWLLRLRGGRAFTGRLFGNREELRFLMQESAQVLTTEERAMINRVLDLQARTVRQVMKPLNQAVTVAATLPMAEALQLCREHHFTRFPVWENRDGRQRIIGLITFNSLLYQADLDLTKTVGDYVKPAIYLDEDLRLEVALRRLQRSGQRLAIVLRPDHRESGIITLQDMLKIIFGEVSL